MFLYYQINDNSSSGVIRKAGCALLICKGELTFRAFDTRRSLTLILT
jgi:hypothetical protein